MRHSPGEWITYACLAALLCGCRGAQPRENATGEMVLYGTTSEIRGFDPIKAGDVASAMAISKVSEGLVQYAYLARPYRVEPMLAAGMPDVSADGLTYTFQIRPGIFFQDDPCFEASGGKGRELVAEDFVYSIKRVADAKNLSTGYWVYDNRIAGLDEFHEASKSDKPTDYAARVEGLQAPDRCTLRIVLKAPYPQLLWVLTMQYAFAVAREAVDYYGSEFVNHPVGTGPYVLKRWRRNYRLEFERNPKWVETGRIERYPAEGEPADAAAGLLADAGRPVPFIDRIVQYVQNESTTPWLMFLTGQIESSGISRDNWDAVITAQIDLTDDLREKKIVLYTSPTLDTYYIGFNMEDPVVGADTEPGQAARNKKLRQALTCAFDTGEWIKFFNNRIIRATGPLPPGIAGYEEKPSPYPFDLEKARRLLREAGYPDGKDPKTGRRLELTLELGSADPETRQSAELNASFFERIGVVLKLSYNNWPAFLQKMERKQAQIYRLGWVADYPDAENFLQLFYGPNSSPGPNHANYVNPEFDRLYERIRTMLDTPERTAFYRQMADMIIEDCPWIFMHHPKAYGLQHHWVQNHKPHDFPYGMTKYRKLDVAARRRWHQEHR